MANDLLDLSRIGHGKIELDLQPVDLQTVIDDAVVGVRPAIEGRGQRLLLERPGHPLIVHGDADRLAQVLSNLLGNASKYTPTGGQIWLTVEEPEAHVRMKELRGAQEIIVSPIRTAVRHTSHRCSALIASPMTMTRPTGATRSLRQ